MKKYFLSFFIILVSVSTSFAQNESNYAAPEGGGGTTCNCTAPSTSSCRADCLYSTCCICWNPNTQSGVCGCYFGIASCKNGKNSASLTMNSSNFGEIDPDARIYFSFEKFSLLFDYFKSKGIRYDLLENVFISVKSRYVLTGQKISIGNTDFAQIVTEYTTLIDHLDIIQKEDLNKFITASK